MASIYFLEMHYPAKAEKDGIDSTVAYASPKLALDYAKKKAKDGRDNVVIKNIGDDGVGVFVDLGKGELALLMQYKVKTVELIKG